MTTPSTHGGHVGESPPVTLKSGKTDRNSAGRADMIDLFITKLVVVKLPPLLCKLLSLVLVPHEIDPSRISAQFEC